MNDSYPDSKVHGATMVPTWVLSAPDGPHVGLMNLAIRVVTGDAEYNLSVEVLKQIICTLFYVFFSSSALFLLIYPYSSRLSKLRKAE